MWSVSAVGLLQPMLLASLILEKKLGLRISYMSSTKKNITPNVAMQEKYGCIKNIKLLFTKQPIFEEIRHMTCSCKWLYAPKTSNMSSLGIKSVSELSDKNERKRQDSEIRLLNDFLIFWY